MRAYPVLLGLALAAVASVLALVGVTRDGARRIASPSRAATGSVVVDRGAGVAPIHPRSPLTRLDARSLQGRPISAIAKGYAGAAGTVLVIGCIHGNEPAGIAVVRDLAADPPKAGTMLWLVANLNPDGVRADTRANARGVDLNRNFPYGWRDLGPRGAVEYAGPRSLSEPESRFAATLIRTLRPAVTIWFHQALGVVDASGGATSIERRYARLVGLPLVRLPRYPGSAASWQDHLLAGTSAFVVELPAGPLDQRGVERYSDAVLALATRLHRAGS